jgi:hypothetical protein
VNLFDGSGEQEASDFTSSPFPDFGVPEMWCTDNGMSIMENTGEKIMKMLVNDNVSSVKVQFVSDLVQRDADSSFAVANGMAKTSLRADGLFEVLYDRNLFNPLNESLCKVMYSPRRFRDDVEARLRQVRQPSLGLANALERMEQLAGVGVAGHLPLKPHTNLTLVEDGKKGLRFEGPVNVLKLFAEMMFYSRASGIEPPFLPNASIEDVYQMLAWVHWSRSVLSIGNAKAATEGSLMARAILERLEHPTAGSYDATVTIFMGHDGTIDNVGTALGVKWQLRLPYDQSSYSATPPGSGLHLFVDDAKTVELSYLYPVFFNGTGASWNLRSSINMESAPLLFDPPIGDGFDVSVGQKSTILMGGRDRRTGLDVLQDRILFVLSNNPGSLECYNMFRPMNETDGCFLWPLTTRNVVVLVSIVAMLTIPCLFLLVYCNRKCPHRKATKDSKYNAVANNVVEVV